MTRTHALAGTHANGGVAIDDARIVLVHANLIINNRGVDDHEMTSTPLSTSGGVTSATSGEDAIMPNQHAYHEKIK